MCSGKGNETCEIRGGLKGGRAPGPRATTNQQSGEKSGSGGLERPAVRHPGPIARHFPVAVFRSHNPFVGSGRLRGAAGIPLPAPRPNARRGSDGTPLARETADTTGPRETYSVVEEVDPPAPHAARRRVRPHEVDTCGRAKTRGVRIGRPARLPVDQPGRWSGRFDDRARIRESTSLTWPRGSSASAVFVTT